MLLGVVTSDGNIMPSFIFPHGHRLNMEAYIKCFEEVDQESGCWKTV